MEWVLKSNLFYWDEDFKLNAFEVPLGRGRYAFYERQRNYGTWTQ